MKIPLKILLICSAFLFCNVNQLVGQEVRYSISDFSNSNKFYPVKSAHVIYFENKKEYSVEVNYVKSERTVYAFLLLESVLDGKRQTLLKDTLLEFDDFIMTDQQLFFDEFSFINSDNDPEMEIVLSFRYSTNRNDEKFYNDFALIYDDLSRIKQKEPLNWLNKVIFWENIPNSTLNEKVLQNLEIKIEKTEVRFPKYTEVSNEFLKQATESKLSREVNFNLVKKKEGWFYQELNRISDSLISEQLFWDSKKHEYKQLTLSSGKTFSNNYLRNILNRNSAWKDFIYDCSPYYGYVGYEQELITDFGSSTNLSDSILFGLGTAYSRLATNLLPSQNINVKELVISNELLTEYKKYRHLAIECFKKIELRNPKFETKIGLINQQVANESMLAYIDILTHHKTTEANKELIDVSYSDFYINFAKNILKSCDSNSILISTRIYSFYPLLYVQAKLGFRKDITLVNYIELNQKKNIADLILQNNWKRPVYCDNTFESFEDMGVKTIEVGLIEKLIQSQTSNQSKNLDNSKTFDLIVNKYSFNGLSNASINEYEIINKSKMLLINAMFNLKENKDSLQLLLHTYETTFLKSPFEFQTADLSLIEIYYLNNQKEKARKLIEKIVHYWQEHQNTKINISIYSSEQYRESIISSTKKVLLFCIEKYDSDYSVELKF